MKHWLQVAHMDEIVIISMLV
uniref:Uncharacterized protein n=1 Tax=Rhizophora mucronata TaxID=61149 RepID=A0A2P2NDX4_RHIMU